MRIKRDIYLNKLIERKNNGLIKIVTGIRRCGKSFLLNELFAEHLHDSGISDDHIIKITLEGIANKKYTDPEYTYNYIREHMTDSSTYYIMIDEVQMMKDFVDVLNGLMILKNTDVYVTGSNSRFLSSDIATEFRGRGDVVQMHPLRFKEFLTAYNDRDEAWDDYVTYGGMPLVLSYQTEASRQNYLIDLFKSTLIRDVIDLNNLKNEDNFEELLNILASGIGSLTDPTKLENSFRSVKNISFPHTTIDRYISCLADAFIISRSDRYNVKGKRYIGSPYKIYFEDVGLRNAKLNFRQIEENHIMENIIYNELRIRGYRADVGVVEYYRKDENGKTVRCNYEVDFVVNRGSERYYIQSAFEIPDEEKMKQEKKSLSKINDSFKKIIIQRGYLKPRIDEDGIVQMGIINFLLDDNAI